MIIASSMNGDCRDRCSISNKALSACIVALVGKTVKAHCRISNGALMVLCRQRVARKAVDEPVSGVSTSDDLLYGNTMASRISNLFHDKLTAGRKKHHLASSSIRCLEDYLAVRDNKLFFDFCLSILSDFLLSLLLNLALATWACLGHQGTFFMKPIFINRSSISIPFESAILSLDLFRKN